MTQLAARSRSFARRGAIAGAAALLIICAYGIVYQGFTYTGPEAKTFWSVFAYFLWVAPVSGATAALAVVIGNGVLLFRRGRAVSPKIGAAIWAGLAVTGTGIALWAGVDPSDAAVVGAAVIAGGLTAILRRGTSGGRLEPARPVTDMFDRGA